VIRHTQGALVFEIYRLLTRPFIGEPIQLTSTENARVKELEQRLAEMESQNRQLQQLLGYVAKQPNKGITAPVIGRSADQWWQQVVLGRGSSDGIKPGYIVSGIGGLVGRVTEVTPNTSRVLLISDPNSRVGVTVSRSRNMGYIRGQSANRVIMVFVDKVPDVRQGDVITTSALSRLFPAGLPVGRVESINFNKSPAPEAVIELSAPISYLEWVMVAPNPMNPDVDAQENLSEPAPQGEEGDRSQSQPSENTTDTQGQVTESNLPAESIYQFQNRDAEPTYEEAPAQSAPPPSTEALSPEPAAPASSAAPPVEPPAPSAPQSAESLVEPAAAPEPIEVAPPAEAAPPSAAPAEAPAPIENLPPAASGSSSDTRSDDP
jgi:rod shape-determining protein MreC